MRKLFVILLCVCMVICFAACGNHAPDRELAPDEPAEPTAALQEAIVDAAEDIPDSEASPDIEMPTATSREAELYLFRNESGSNQVVNKYGFKADGYSIDENGNLLDRDGKIMIVQENLLRFIPVRALDFVRADYQIDLIAREEMVANDPNVTRVNQYHVDATLSLNIGPATATSPIILLRSTDSNVAEIRANTNQRLIVDGGFALENGQIALRSLDNSGKLDFAVTAKYPGQAKIIATTLNGDVTAECVLNVQYGSVESAADTYQPVSEIVNASGNSTQHTHNYVSAVIEPTIWDKGYTLFTCTECGYSYMDNFTSKLPAHEENEVHVHNYIASVVAPTSTERGYTLYVCEGCGDSYKDNYVDPYR